MFESRRGLYAQAPNNLSSATSLLLRSARGEQTACQLSGLFAHGPKLPVHDTPNSSNLQSPDTFGTAASGTDVRAGHIEEDDILYSPDPRQDRARDKTDNVFTSRGLEHGLSVRLVDLDTPLGACTTTSYGDGSERLLIFSDKFNTDRGALYPGDDLYGEAHNDKYAQLGGMFENQNYYILQMTWSGAIPWPLPPATDPWRSLCPRSRHGPDHHGGMMSSWNKFCYTGGMVEMAVSPPGAANIVGLWLACWMAGNLGRAGYGTSLEGTWPYTYDECDVGTTPNQTLNGLPLAATTQRRRFERHRRALIPAGQRVSRCTRPGESHPGSIHSDGTYVGRSAPEIDIFEAQVYTTISR
ncbi:glycoside hydrolase family 16 protein [Athelia psychrophila]|uniref:Glycoside hydrolase family 16 protein n=1 Tax=Athelia psychrophila TaxID=1759441 RepID=A0A167V7P2_9AGAM|nr:glycoside hydrolase family 16 protein [Fibularhizoctonia sp. CBS 109695]